MAAERSGVVVYHSGFGHTELVAGEIQQGMAEGGMKSEKIKCSHAAAYWELLHAATTIVFGCPTCFGNASAEFKQFTEATGLRKQPGPFGTSNAGRTNWLPALPILLPVTGINSIPSPVLPYLPRSTVGYGFRLAILPVFEHNSQQLSPNGMASYLGLKIMSDNVTGEVNLPEDLITAFAFGERIATVSKTFTL
jgi:hypothetical protein